MSFGGATSSASKSSSSAVRSSRTADPSSGPVLTGVSCGGCKQKGVETGSHSSLAGYGCATGTRWVGKGNGRVRYSLRETIGAVRGGTACGSSCEETSRVAASASATSKATGSGDCSVTFQTSATPTTKLAAAERSDRHHCVGEPAWCMGIPLPLEFRTTRPTVAAIGNERAPPPFPSSYIDQSRSSAGREDRTAYNRQDLTGPPWRNRHNRYKQFRRPTLAGAIMKQ